MVKGSGCRQFNQVDPDHSQEWLNGTGKRVGVIVSITKTSRGGENHQTVNDVFEISHTHAKPEATQVMYC